MIISNPDIIVKNGYLNYQVQVQFCGKTEILWYKLEEGYEDLVSDRSDAPLVALLIPAMSQGEDIKIEGTVSEKLIYNLSGPYQTVLKLIIPSLHCVKIIPSDVRPAHSTGQGVAMGFSGGIDSFSVLADHHNSNVTDGFRVTHLLFNNVGSHGDDEKKSKRLFHRRYNRLKPLTEQMGLPFIAIDSNINSFYQDFTFVKSRIMFTHKTTPSHNQGFVRVAIGTRMHGTVHHNQDWNAV